jgi:hypothetical protein
MGTCRVINIGIQHCQIAVLKEELYMYENALKVHKLKCLLFLSFTFGHLCKLFICYSLFAITSQININTYMLLFINHQCSTWSMLMLIKTYAKQMRKCFG